MKTERPKESGRRSKASKARRPEFQTPTFYGSWLVHVLIYHAKRYPVPIKVESGDEENQLAALVAKMRLDPNIDPVAWEDRFYPVNVGRDVESIPHYARMAIVACAYGVAAEQQDKLPAPNRAWDYAFAAAWWGGSFGGAMDRFDEFQSSSRAKQDKAAGVRHSENRSMKAEAREWYTKNRHAMSKDAAAEALARKVFPVSFRTVRDWLKEPKSSDD